MSDNKNKPHFYYNADLNDTVISEEIPKQLNYIIIEDVVIGTEDIPNRNNRIYENIELPHIDLNNIKNVKIQHVEKKLVGDWGINV